jgi:transposase InsO family protein
VLWVSDFTYVATWQNFVYVAFVIDAYAGAIVGWEASASKHTRLVESAIRQAAALRSRRAIRSRTPSTTPMPDLKADSTGRRNTVS